MHDLLCNEFELIRWDESPLFTFFFDVINLLVEMGSMIFGSCRLCRLRATAFTPLPQSPRLTNSPSACILSFWRGIENLI